MDHDSSSQSGKGDARACLSPGASVDALADITILVCRSCRLQSDPRLDPRPGSILADNAVAAGIQAGVSVKPVECLGNCRRGLSAAFLRTGSWSYVFGGLGPDSAGDLIAGARVFAGSTDGFMPFRERPEALKRGLVARVPSFDSLKDLP